MGILNPRLVHQIFRGIWVALIIAGIAYAFYYVIPLIYPFIFGWILALMLNPIVNFFQFKLKFPRWLAVSFSMLLFLAAMVTAITLLVANIVVELGSLADTLQLQINRWVEQFNVFINSTAFQDWIEKINEFFENNPKYQETVNNNLSSTAGSIADVSKFIINYVFNTLKSLLTSLPNIATITIIIMLATFFISKDWYQLIQRYKGIFSDLIVKTTQLIRNDLQKALFGYIRAQLILVSLTALVVIIGLLVLRVDYAITIGLLTGLADLMPYLGTGAVMVPWILYVFFAQGNLVLGIGLSVLYGVIVIARQIMEPKVLASSVGLDPLATLIAMFVGLKLFGLLGLIIGPVSLILISAFYRARIFHDIATYIKKGSAPSE
ncbi:MULTISPECIES: sporulation integral membrane protein YtvI [Paenibacillus]|uniref:Sporulation integral membrane protein YtvI n=3 Tax=Paenibacillus TaxID=44249 RepID=A0ABU3RLZ4_9BACL|nr:MULTISPECIES: sporulation integral membrane protein YtvI [Paenibacillus]MBA2944040.1 sporulation integral membrane protein YtvI [Paenibacillus sp. CGMCC 1.16610]MCY9663044.1 sporulation integral membrane protein YtvI [Paenibacillus anseongense]MDU0205214.1 sporulation integral membrane protein YtvI [Paenibacillus sp. PFR10]MEB4797889.1 sporulation integral membrane protein YtvI [Paenibacillus chondroitinus]MEC0267950.1 sporulation integral membrane protein YtvI [Paenibacillus anseongense]